MEYRRRRSVQIGLMAPRARSTLEMKRKSEISPIESGRSESGTQSSLSSRPSKEIVKPLLDAKAHPPTNSPSRAASFLVSHRSITSAKNKKEIIAILSPEMQIEQQIVHQLKEALNDSPHYRWSLRTVNGQSVSGDLKNDSRSMYSAGLTPRAPLHFLQSRIDFESPGLKKYLEEGGAGDEQDGSESMESTRSANDDRRVSTALSDTGMRSITDGIEEYRDSDDDDEDDNDHELETPMDQLMKSRNSLHDYVGGQLRELSNLRRELDLNYEVVAAASQIADEHETYRRSSSMSTASGNAYLLAILRKRSGRHPSVDPRELGAQADNIRLQRDIDVVLKDISAHLADLNSRSTRPTMVTRGADDPQRFVRNLSDLSSYFRKVLRSIATSHPGYGWVLESCWKGAMLVHECCIARQHAFLEHVNGQLQCIDLRQSSSKVDMSSAVTKLQSSFDVDVYKNSLEILQKEMHTIKKENISLRSRVKQSELLIRQRLLRHLAGEDNPVADDDDASEAPALDVDSLPQLHSRQPSTVQVPVSKHLQVRTPIVDRPSSASDSVPTVKKPVRHLYSTGMRYRPGATDGATDETLEKTFISASTIGLERMSLPSTTLRPVAVDLVLDRLPQAVHHALKTVKADLNAAEMDDAELYRLCIEIMVASAVEHGHSADDEATPIRHPLELPDFLKVFFMMRYGTKKRADVEMGRLCRALQNVYRQDVEPTPCGTLPVTSWMSKFVGIARGNLPLQAYSVVVYAFVHWHQSHDVEKTHSKALNALFDSKSTILVGGGDVDRSVPRKASTDFLSPDLLIPLEVADVILTKTHAAFGFHSSSFEMAKSHLESEAILADGSAISPGDRALLLTLHHIHQGIEARCKAKQIRVDDIESLFRRFDPRRCGRMQLLQFISCIRSLHCNVTDADIHSIIRLFDTSSKNFQEVDYKKFAKCFSPVTQFVTVHTMMSSVITMWSSETLHNETRAMRSFVTNDFKQRVYDLAEFTGILQSVDPDISARDAATYFQECLDISGTNFVTRETFLTMARSHSLFNRSVVKRCGNKYIA